MLWCPWYDESLNLLYLGLAAVYLYFHALKIHFYRHSSSISYSQQTYSYKTTLFTLKISIKMASAVTRVIHRCEDAQETQQLGPNLKNDF